MLVEINVLTIEAIECILLNSTLLCAILGVLMMCCSKKFKKTSVMYKLTLCLYMWVVVMCSDLGSQVSEFFAVALQTVDSQNRLIIELGFAVLCITLGVIAQKAIEVKNEIIYRMIGVTAQSTGISILGRYAMNVLGLKHYAIVTGISILALLIIDGIIYFGKIKNAYHFSISTIKLYFSVFTTAFAVLSAFEYCQGLKQKMDELEKEYKASKKQKDSVVIK